MVELSEPDKDLATRALRRVGTTERLVGITMSGMAGNSPFPVYSLGQAANFLGVINWRGALNPSSRTSVAYLEPEALKRWVRDVFQDEELASAIQEEIEAGSCYAERMVGIKRLLEQRLTQCHDVLAEDSET